LVLLGERSVVPDLMEMLKDSQIADWVRSDIARTIGELAQDEQTMETCVLLLSHTHANVADAIYSALWDMSRRAEVTIVARGDGSSKTVEFIPWQSGMKG